MFYLMVKTHNVTGIKYLCQTQRKNPFKYLGSGVAWGRHLKNNGEDITTEVIGTYETKEELIKNGIKYSKLWDVVDSKEWANLKLEEGDGGDTSHTEGWKLGMARRRSYAGINNPNYGKVGAMRGKVGPMKDKLWWTNGKDQILSFDCPDGWYKGRPKHICSFCNAEVNSMGKRWHFDYCEENPNRIIRPSPIAGLVWWTDGKIEKKSKEIPGQDWKLGRLK